MRDYGKVFSRIWESADFRALSEDGRTLALYLLTCQHGTIAGVFRIPDGYACEDMQWTAERVCEGFRNLEEKGFATRCEDSKWVWVHKFLEWNPPENPNQRKAAVKMALSVPDGCGWKRAFMRACAVSLGVEQPQQDNGLPRVEQPLPNQKQKQKQEQKQDEEPTALSAAKLPPCPHHRILELFAQRLPDMPQPKPELWTGQRSKDLAARWKWLLTATKHGGKDRYATTEQEAIDWLDRFFGYVAKSDFLTGRDGRWGNCDLGWLMKADNFAKVVQGNYENKAAA